MRKSKFVVALGAINGRTRGVELEVAQDHAIYR